MSQLDERRAEPLDIARQFFGIGRDRSDVAAMSAVPYFAMNRAKPAYD